jgi:hypothetical protein
MPRRSAADVLPRAVPIVETPRYFSEGEGVPCGCCSRGTVPSLGSANPENRKGCFTGFAIEDRAEAALRWHNGR